MDINLNWVPQNVEDLLPQRLRESFRRQVVEPVEREEEQRRFTENCQSQIEYDMVGLELDALAPELEAAKLREIEAQKKQRTAEADLRSATAERERVQFTMFELRGKRETLKSRIEANHSPLIDEFINEHWKLFNKVRNRVNLEERRSEPNRITEKRAPIFVSNKADIDRTIEQILAAIRKANEMTNETLTDAEIRAKLQNMRIKEPLGFKVETIKA